ncbi:MAG: hypothetical protein GXO79_09220 [Chlorobi bacterium]|nr:hypothetical protein [Chlorobiota bacterium]
MDELFNYKGRLGSKFNNFEYKPKNDLWNSIHENIDIHKPTGPLHSVFSNFHYYPHRRVWAGITNSIHPERKKYFLRNALAVAASLTILVGSVFIFKNMQLNRSLISGNKQTANLSRNKIPQSTEPSPVNKNTLFLNINNDSLKKDNLILAESKNTIIGNEIEAIEYEKTHKTVAIFKKIIPISFMLNGVKKIVVLSKRPFLNLSFKGNEKSRSIGINGMLAANMNAVLQKSDALASSNFDYSSSPQAEIGNNSVADYSKVKLYDNITNYPPLTLGFVFNYSFTKRVSLSTGINYTRLSTFAYSEGDNWRLEYRSSKHYVGIPVNINFRIIQQKKYSMFLFSGLQFEEGLIDKNKTTDYKNNDILNEYLSSSKFIGGQASYNFGFGTAYRLSRKFDFYLKANLSYYFYQSHYNVWAEHKYWPGLQIGLRYNL